MKKDFGNQLKKCNMENKDNKLNILLSILAIYCLFSICRSLNLLFLVYTEEYFYNLDFKMELFIENNEKYINHYYFVTYAMAIIFSLFLKKIANLKWISYLISLIISFILFRFLDSNLVRPFFTFFDNPRVNVCTNLIVFSVILFFLIIVLKRKEIAPSNEYKERT